MQELNVFERLAKTHPTCEIWWDSSPLVYKNWAERLIASFEPDRRETVCAQLLRMLNPNRLEDTFYRGCTTNPPLSLAAINDNPAYWQKAVEGIVREHRGIGRERLFWETYKQVVKKGSDFFRPLWEATGGKFGYISGQVDPRRCYDYDVMLEQALDLRGLGPNIMIKCPGTKEGYRLVRELTSRGIPTNNTLTFVLSQLLMGARMAMEGLEIARKNGVDLSKWRAVITHMCARYGDLGGLKKFAEGAGVSLSESDVRWAELAIFKKAYRLVRERGYKSKMLICSMRVSPPVPAGAKKAVWHLEKVAGADIVYTCPPPFIDAVMKNCWGVEFDRDAINEEPPADVMERLMKVPYFSRAYDEKGYTPDEFNTHPALVATRDEFSNATQKMVEFVANKSK